MSEPMWKQYGLLGETPLLQFVNTVDDAGKTRDENALPDWGSVLDWAVAAGVLGPDERAGAEAAGDAGALAHLLDLREAFWSVLHAAATGGTAEPDAVETVRDALRDAVSSASIRIEGKHISWRVDATDAGAAIVARRLALDFLDLMGVGKLDRLRECNRCTAIYLDQGRGPGRKWCRMRTCGSRTKVSRYRKRSGNSG